MNEVIDLQSATLKERLVRRDSLAGMHIALTDPGISELCGMIGYDFLWIDTEHTAIDYQTLAMHLIAARAGGTPAIVRIPWNDPILAKRVLEMGPEGIVFPVVNTVQELEKAMSSTLYPPYGNRGFGPMRAVRYGLGDADEYIRNGSMNMARCVQIESCIAVDNLKEMAKNPYVDCFIFGPCDLSGSIGQLNRIYEEPTLRLIRRAIDILQEAGKSIGVSTASNDINVLKLWHEMGINVISAGTDYLHITNGAKAELDAIRSVQSKNK